MSEINELDAEDVISSGWMVVFVNKELFRWYELRQNFRTWLVSNKGLSDKHVNLLLGEGAPCEFLRTSGGGWKKGKLRLRLEFIPDPEPEAKKSDSPLDEFRQK